MLPGRRDIISHVYWWDDRAKASDVQGQTTAGGKGKPSRTHTDVRAHCFHGNLALSLLAVNIGTGRRHQIRSHASYIGHPVVTDGLYTSFPVFQSDKQICARNFLHRYRLSFRDALQKSCKILVKLPIDLADALKSFDCKGHEWEVHILDLI